METRLYVRGLNSTTYVHEGGYEELDLYDNISIPLTLKVADIKDISKKNTSYSSEFTIPATKHNIQTIGTTSVAEYDMYFEMGKKYDCYIVQDNYNIFNGIFMVNDVVVDNNELLSYKCQITSNVKSFFDTIAEQTLLGNEDFWNDIDFSEYSVNVNDYSDGYWLDKIGYNNRPLPTPNDGWGFCVIDRHNHNGVEFGKFEQPRTPGYDNYYRWGQEWYEYELTPYLFHTNILNKIIHNAGFKWESNFFGHSDSGWHSGHSFITDASAGILLNQIGKFDTDKMVYTAPTRNGLINTGNNHTPIYVNAKNDLATEDDAQGSQIVYLNVPHRPLDDYAEYANTTVNYPFQSPYAAQYQSNTLTPYTFVLAPTQWSEQGWYKLILNYKFQVRVAFGKSPVVNLANNNITYNSLDDGDTVVMNRDIVKLFHHNITTTPIAKYRVYLGKLYNGTQWQPSSARLVYEKEVFANIDDVTNNFTFNSQDSLNLLIMEDEVDTNNIFYAQRGDTWAIHTEVEVIDVKGVQNQGFYMPYFYWCIQDDDNIACLVSGIGVHIIKKQGENAFTFEHIDDDNISPRRDVDPTEFLNKNTKKTDYITNLCKQFNLYIEDVGGKKCNVNNNAYPPKTLRIEPRDVYYKPEGTFTNKYLEGLYTKDWTDKVDFSSISFNRPDDYLYTSCLFTQKDDGDYYVEAYNTNANMDNGNHLFNAIYDTTKEDKVEVGFGQTICGGSERSELVKTAKMLAIKNDKLDLDKVWNDRILFISKYKGENDPINYARNKYLIIHRGNTDVYDQYPLVSMQNSEQVDSNLRTLATADLNFGKNDYYINRQIKCTCNNAYNAFYLNQMHQLTDVNARVLSCDIKLSANDIHNLTLSDVIIIDSVKYHIISVDYKDDKTLSHCELLKILPDKYVDDYDSKDIQTGEKYYDCVTDYSITIPTDTGSGSGSNGGGSNGGGGTSITNNTYNINQGGGSDYTLSGGGNQVNLLENSSVKNTINLYSYSLDGESNPHTYNIQFFRDGTMIEDVPIDEFSGATQNDNGYCGLVPYCSTANRNNFLRGDGTWTAISGTNYTLDNNQQDRYGIDLKENGNVVSTVYLPEFEGCGAHVDGEAGLVPASHQGQQDYYLAGNATWKPIPSGTSNVWVGILDYEDGVYDTQDFTWTDIQSAYQSNKELIIIKHDYATDDQFHNYNYYRAINSNPTEELCFEFRSEREQLTYHHNNTFTFTSLPNYIQSIKVNNNAVTPVAYAYNFANGTNTNLVVSNTNKITINATIPNATSSVLGGIKVNSSILSSAGSVSGSTDYTIYPIQVTSSNVAAVKIPNAPTYTPIQPIDFNTTKISVQPCDVNNTPYRNGQTYCDYVHNSTPYTDKSGTVTPMYTMTLNNGEIDEVWDVTSIPMFSNFQRGKILPITPNFVEGDKTKYLALPITMIKSIHGSIPVVLLPQKFIDLMSGEYDVALNDIHLTPDKHK